MFPHLEAPTNAALFLVLTFGLGLVVTLLARYFGARTPTALASSSSRSSSPR